MPNNASAFEAILIEEGLLPEGEMNSCADCSLDDCECWDGPLDRLHGLLVEWGMSPQEFELTVEQNADALKDFLLARVGDFE